MDHELERMQNRIEEITQRINEDMIKRDELMQELRKMGGKRIAVVSAVVEYGDLTVGQR
ncbi:MAG: hypothetical protein WCF23_09590 [Candidatus Nitrosopolaris sp.]